MSFRYLITGATGLIGKALACDLIDGGNDVVALVRNRRKAEAIFGDRARKVEFVEQDVMSPIKYSDRVDYIVHAAAPTGSKFFVEHPVETMDIITMGTKSVMEFMREHAETMAVIVLSSMEAYGNSQTEDKITEDMSFAIDVMAARSSYPMAKRASETMCYAYYCEHGVPVKVIRLAQVIGKELGADDNRVIAQFVRAAKSGADIILETDGRSAHSYVGIDDVVSGIDIVLKKGESGQIYNLANERNYASIRDLAGIVANEIMQGGIKVVVKNGGNGIYAPSRKLNLDTGKMRSLGWEPRDEVLGMLRRLIEG